MSHTESREVEQTLQKPDVHRSWENAYRTSENDKFYDMAFDCLADLLAAPADSLLLDAGCGICDYSIRLAKHGFKVVAIDFSESVLGNAAANIKVHGMEERMKLQLDNLLSLSFADATFDYILCWGVLMHIPDVNTAISELCRVLKPGGTIIVSEGNMHSVEARLLPILKKALGRQKEDMAHTAAGLEYWAVGESGRLLSRQADIHWLTERFAAGSCALRKRIAGQFTELYARVSSPLLKSLIHAFNRFWFNHVGSPQLACGNILILEKRGAR